MDDAMTRNDATGLKSFWMPFTANRAFRADPTLFVTADGNYYTDGRGRRVLDAMAGLWCVNAGHRRKEIGQAISDQFERLDYISSFGMGHPAAFEFAAELIRIAPEGFEEAFFVNSGSEAVDTALKIARVFHLARGEGSRTRFIGRAKAYHGVGFGGLSVGGIGRHRKTFGPLLGETVHLPHTYDPERNRFARGLPAHGCEKADALEDIIATYDASTIAAVIVEPVAGASGVFPPPVGYLRRLREICDRHGILLIFDEVITGFGRLGAPFAAQAFGVSPDLITTAKGLTNGAIPAGAVLAKRAIFDALAANAAGSIELMHGYTYSAHPLACAAGLATLRLYREEALFERARQLGGWLEEAAHGLDGAPTVTDVRNIGVLSAVDIEPRCGEPGMRGPAIARECLARGVLIRAVGDTLIVSPPLTFTQEETERCFAVIGEALKAA